MSLASQILDQRTTKIMSEYTRRFRDEASIPNDPNKLKSVSFVFLVATIALDLNEDEAIDGIVDGGNDFGVDAIYYGDPDDGEIQVTIIQGKYKNDINNDSQFPENGITKLIDAMRSLFDPSVDITVNERLSRRVEEIRSFVADGFIPRINAIASNNGRKWNEISDERISNSRSEFYDQVEWRFVGPEEILTLLQAQKPIDADLQLRGSSIVEPYDYRRVLVGRISVAELARIVEQYGDRLLERNIRRYLGLSGNRVNEAVASTLRDPEKRKDFYFYNNGITIVCSQFRYNALQKTDWQLKVAGLQIVNGGQTSKTVHQISREIGPDIGDAEVLVRIYELPSDDHNLVSAITYATNSQNPVDLRDLKANDARQKKLTESINALGFGYRTKREEKPLTSEDFTSAVIAEAVLAIWRHRPHQARFAGGKHFGTLYDHIFTENLNGAQAVIAAIILRQVENRRKRPPEGAPDFLIYGSRFVAMMVGKYLLEDLNTSLEKLDHRNFQEARANISENMSEYIERAEAAIEQELNPLFENREKTLQRLSATFRRADLIQTLLNEELRAV